MSIHSLLQLYHRRDKVIRSDEDQIKRLWEQIGPQYMTEESSDEEGAMKLHHLQWESDGNVCLVKVYAVILLFWQSCKN